MAVVDASETRTIQVPSLGHCLRTANTPGLEVASNVSAIVRRASLTSPSADPLTEARLGTPSRVAACTRNTAPAVELSNGFTGDSIDSQGGHFA
jgi:hypothetical protein